MRFVLAIHCTCDTPRRLSSAPFPLPPPLHSLLPTLFPTLLHSCSLLLVANCVVYRFVAVVVVFVSLLCSAQLFLCISTTLPTSSSHADTLLPPLSMIVLQLKIMFSLLGERWEKRGRGPGLFCVGQFGSVRFGCLLSIIWLIFHIRQNLFAVLAIYIGDTPCTINHRLANLVYDVERWRKEK